MALTWQTGLRRELPELVRNCRESIFAIAQSRAFLATLALVAMADGVLLGLGLSTVYFDAQGTESPAWFYLNAEFSFGEIWEYCLTAAAAAGLLWRYRKLREPVIGCLGVVFVWLTFDNSLALHEAIGHLISPLFIFAEHSSPNPDDYGELLTQFIVGSVILFELARTALRSPRHSVIQSLAIIAVLGGTAFFGVFFDFLDRAIPDPSQLLKSTMSLIEDGSEMVLLSIASVIAMTAKPPASTGRPA